jgi:hypothetical protein
LKKQKPTLMLKFFLSIIFLLGSFNLFAQASENVTVYSTTGKVDLISGKSSRQLKSYDVLTPKTIVVLSPNSKLFFITADKKMREFTKTGKFTVAKISASVKNTPGEMSNTMSLIINHFFEKGKSYQDKMNFSTAGVVTRGGSEKLMLFPMYNSAILFQHKIVPVFNPKLVDSTVVIQIDLVVNDLLKNNYRIKNGEAIVLPNDLKSSDEVYLKLINGIEPEQIKLSIANVQKKNAVTKEMAQLEADFKSEDTGNLLLAKALFFESKGFNVDALDCYNQLIQLSGNDANYIEQKNVFLKEVIQ